MKDSLLRESTPGDSVSGGSSQKRPYDKDSSTDRIQDVHVGSDEVSRTGKPANKGRIIVFISTVSKWRLIPLGNSKCHRRSQSYIILGGEILGCYNSRVCQSLVEGCSCRALFLWHFLPLAVWAFAGQKASRWMGVSSHRHGLSAIIWLQQGSQSRAFKLLHCGAPAKDRCAFTFGKKHHEETLKQ